MWRSWVLQLSPRAIFNRDKDLRGRSDIVIHSPRLMLRTMIPESIARSVIMPRCARAGKFYGFGAGEQLFGAPEAWIWHSCSLSEGLEPLALTSTFL
jgi:hypothetical protein